MVPRPAMNYTPSLGHFVGSGSMMIDDATFVTWRPRMLSLLRIVVALLFLEHGLSKFTGFPVPGPGTLSPLLVIAGLIEIVGSVLLLIGLFARATAFVMSGEMAFAYFMAHAPQGFYPIANHGENAILFCFVFLYLAVAGGGAWSVDRYRRGLTKLPLA
jgi:putative oxidoreductase